MWENGNKRNTLHPDDLTAEGVLFENSNLAFTLAYLRYHGSLHDRGFLSTNAIAWCYKDLHGADSVVAHFHERHNTALFLYLAMQELAPLKRHLNIIIDDEVSPGALAAYDAHLHHNVFPPADCSQVRELSGDGHEKVITKVCCPPKKRAGAPNKTRTTPKPYTNGWFFLVHPGSHRILSVVSQFEPEGNDTVNVALEKVLMHYPKANTFIYDRNCAYAPSASKRPALKQLKFYAIDRMHGAKHNKRCKHAPQNSKRLRRRLNGVNTSASEQVFSWFRGYASTVNEMRELRHRFLVLYYAKRHNEQVARGDTEHLNAHSAASKKKRAIRGYPCKKPAAKRR